MITEHRMDDFWFGEFLRRRIYNCYGNSSKRNREAYNILDGYTVDDNSRNIAVIIMIIERDEYYDVVFNNIAKSFKINKQNKWYSNIIEGILSYNVKEKMKK